MLKHIVVLLFVTSSVFCSAQVHKGFRWIAPDHYLYTVDLGSGLLCKESPKKVKTELGLIKDWELITKDLPGDFDINAFHQKDTILITIPGTGLLYTLNLPTLELARLDQTFFRGYNFNAAQFIRKDTLFSIGGEGFWQRHSIVTYYNPKTAEWDLYDSKNQTDYPTTFRFSGYSSTFDTFFSANLDADSVLEKKKIYFTTYSFKQKNWETKGEITQELLDFAKKGFRSVWTGRYLILFNDLGRNNGDIRILDPFGNELYEYLVQDNHFFLYNAEIFFSKGYLYSRNLVSTGKQDKFSFDSLSVDSMVKRSKNIGKVYETTSKTGIYILNSLALLLLITGLLIYRYRVSKRRNTSLSDLEWLVVSALIQSTDGNKISSTALNHLLQLNQKSYDNQRQIRNRVIATINQKLYYHLGANELILRSSNTEDKRMMDYYINPVIKPKELERLVQQVNNG